MRVGSKGGRRERFGVSGDAGEVLLGKEDGGRTEGSKESTVG